MRPAVVWFGEALPPVAWRAAEEAVAEADVVLVVSTSALVYPAAGLIPRHRRGGRTVIEVNLETTPASVADSICLLGPAGSILPDLFDRVRQLQA